MLLPGHHVRYQALARQRSAAEQKLEEDSRIFRDDMMVTLPDNSSHLKIGRAPKGNEKVFQPSIFRGENAVGFRECIPFTGIGAHDFRFTTLERSSISANGSVTSYRDV